MKKPAITSVAIDNTIAERWSGRVAYQFAKDYAGKLQLKS